MDRMVAAVVTLALVPATLAPAGPGPVDDLPDHVLWVHEDNTWNTSVGVVDANGDDVADPVVAGGDRNSPYAHCLVPPGSPAPRLNFVEDTVIAPAARMAVLDGRDGEPLWDVEWASGGLITQRPERERYEFLTDLHTGDLDGDGAEDLLVLRQSHAADRSAIDQFVTMYDPVTGEIRWQIERTLPGDALAVQMFAPFALFGEPGGLLASRTVVVEPGPPPTVTFEVDARLVHLPPGGPPVTFLELEAEDVGLPVPYGDGYRLLSFPARIEGSPPVVSVDARAVDLTLDEDGEPVIQPAWFRPGAGGSPVRIAEGDDPAIVVGRIVDTDNNANVVAMDLADGRDRWVSPINAGPSGGTFTTADVDGDGQHDVIASPAFGPDPTGLFTGGFFPQLTALDGRTGDELWTRIDPTGKFRAWTLDTADVTGSGTPEVIAALTSQDGFPACSQPADDGGMVAAYDLVTGAAACRFPTDRVPFVLAAVDLTGEGADEVVAPTLGGNIYAFTHADPGCGLLATEP